MTPYYELAYALASESLCIFAGTGFSKHITKGVAPDWQTLLKNSCSSFIGGDLLIQELFPNGKPIMPLEECASAISLQMKKAGKDIYESIAEEIKKLTVDPTAALQLRAFIEKHPSIKFVTTNYDNLIEQCIDKPCRTVLCPGFPISRQRNRTEIYHIHGATSYPKEMVVTADDYYKFINFPNYFSKRLDTLIEESTTVMIGYSLGDINFKSILNRHRYSNQHSPNRQHIFFLSRDGVPQHVKDYYDSSFGLRVIENTEIATFLKCIDYEFDLIAGSVKSTKAELMKAIEKKQPYSDEFLKKRDAFKQILATLSSNGLRVQHADVVDFLEDTIDRKHKFSQEFGAWEQYDHLAEWLVLLGCVLEMRGTTLEPTFLEAVTTSFQQMSKLKLYGKSWAAYVTWNSDWKQLTFTNREMVRNHIQKEKITGDFEHFIHI